MSQEFISLWSNQIRPKILTPRAILRAQAEALAKQTGGLLLAEIKDNQRENGMVELDFSFVVPALGGYRHWILTVGDKTDLPYPSMVDAQIFRGSGSQPNLQHALEKRVFIACEYRANSDDEFIELVSQVLTSSSVLSVAQSLIARASEAMGEGEPQAQLSSS